MIGKDIKILAEEAGIVQFVLYVILSYGFFYYAYVYGSTEIGGSDFYEYYPLIGSWDLKSVKSPFNMRLVSNFLTFSLNKSGLFYDTRTTFPHEDAEKPAYFAAVLFNYICVLATSWVLFLRARQEFADSQYSFMVGALYLLSYGMLHFALSPVTEAFSAFLFACILFAYEAEHLAVFALLLIAVFQRELILVFMTLIALLDGLLPTETKAPKPNRARFRSATALASLLGLGLYFVLRGTWFFTPHYAHQLDAGTELRRLVHRGWKLLTPGFWRSAFLTQNLLLLYGLLVLYKWGHRLPIRTGKLLSVASMFFAVCIIALAALPDGAVGRLFSIATPYLILCIAREWRPLAQVQAG